MNKKLAHLFKKYFIPHEHNDYKPHILRREAVIFILAIVVVIEAAFLSQIFIFSPGNKFFAEILKNVLVENTNGSRLADNLPNLKENALLSAAAQNKAQDMAVKGYFAHTSPEGTTPWYWLNNVGYKYSYAGENLAVNFSDSKEVVDAWMNSPSHRENILNNHFTEIGVGVAQGTYENKNATFIVQFFGKPFGEAPIAVNNKPASVGPPADINQAPTNAEVVENKPEVLSAETNFVKETISSPQTRTQYFYLIMLAFVLAAFILNVFVKIKVQHPHIIINGVILILIINTVLFINSYLFSTIGQIF